MIPPKKSLGQNFLKSKAALLSIIKAGDIKPTDIILEVGPGKGALTEYLIQSGANIIAIEKDNRLIPILKETFANAIAQNKLEIIEQDILEFDPSTVQHYGASSYKIIANIPYYITGALIKKFLTADHQPERMVLLVQKEVAQRIVARDGKESILSMSVKAYGTPKYVETVKAKYFSPEPNVDSAIILIENISKNNFTEITEEQFFRIVKSGFAHKRKVLLGNLKLEFPEKNWDELFEKCSINKKARAEDVPLETWFRLAKD